MYIIFLKVLKKTDRMGNARSPAALQPDSRGHGVVAQAAVDGTEILPHLLRHIGKPVFSKFLAGDHALFYNAQRFRVHSFFALCQILLIENFSKELSS